MVLARVTGTVVATHKPASMLGLRLLPAFDPYIIGAPRRGGLFPIAHKARIFRGQGWISATLVVDGRIEGVWRHEQKGRRLTLAIEPFVRPSASLRSGVSAEAERLAAFLGCTLQKIVWTPLPPCQPMS